MLSTDKLVHGGCGKGLTGSAAHAAGPIAEQCLLPSPAVDAFAVSFVSCYSLHTLLRCGTGEEGIYLG